MYTLSAVNFLEVSMYPFVKTCLSVGVVLLLTPPMDGQKAGTKTTKEPSANELKLDLAKALATFWESPVDPSGTDSQVVEVSPDEMKLNVDCVNHTLKEVQAVLRGAWAVRQYKRAGLYTIKGATTYLRSVGIDASKPFEIAELALEADSIDDFKEKLVQKIGEEATGVIAGKAGEKAFEKIYEHILPPAAPYQTKPLKETGAGCAMTVQFTLTPPTKDADGKIKKANIRFEAITQTCKALTAADASAQPSSYRLVAEADLVPEPATSNTVSYKVGPKHYTLRGACGNFPPPALLTASGHLPAKSFEFTLGSAKNNNLYKGKASISASYSYSPAPQTLTIYWFEGYGKRESYLKLDRLEGARENGPRFDEGNINAVRVRFDKGEQLQTRDFDGTKAEFAVPGGATKLVSVEIDFALDNNAATGIKTLTWSEAEISAANKP